jgi:hypothetical protein
VRQGEIYVRAPGPESIAIKSPEDWTALLERCLSHRADLLANIMHRAIGRPSKPALIVSQMLTAASDATADDFISQVAATQIPPEDEIWFRAKSQNFTVNGYALVGNDGDLLAIENPSTLNERVSTALRSHFQRSNMPFRHVRAAERAPQFRTAKLLEREVGYLEGMRLPAMPVARGTEDYWRIYEQGIVTIAESYLEDHIAFRMGSRLRFLLVVVFGRKKLADDRFVRTFTLSWSELRGSYFSAFRRTLLPFFSMFDFPGQTDAAIWLTQTLAQEELTKIDHGMRLFEDDSSHQT